MLSHTIIPWITSSKSVTSQGTLLGNWASEMWYFQGVGNEMSFIQMFKERLTDIYLQTWRAGVSESEKLRTYRSFKFNLATEKYLTVVTNYKFRKSLTKFRCSNHSLRIESGRKDKIDYENRICMMCTLGKVENEFHFLLECPFYESLRVKYLHQYRNGNQNTFIMLLSSTNDDILNKLASYVHFAFKVRNKQLQEVDI